ncbi:RESISTANT TO P. SYRINGAE 5 [Hibiscus trionum]|uniref:RESISTANT TO P. SYRINGAE 5 n=1 Tax=Hibiscus trionum TaxID=183268 RepID=A0A9W7HMC3_HIBTR|nr:RESISTANT TO P. SYRINGAE 5 [Hibiscus trionum]
MDFVLNKIDKHLDNHMSLDQYRKDLKRKLEELNGLKEDIESTMSIELRPRKKLKAEVRIWLENVERINGQVQDLDGRIAGSNALTRGFRAEDVLNSIREVEELITQQGKFHGGLVVDNLQWIGQVLTTTSLSGEAVKACIEEIWQCLMDDEVSKIGVWGMGGLGKTSIMKLINNQLLEETEKFDIVIWITVSKEMSIAKLQKDIASKIGVEFSGDEDETTRAGMLYETLLQKSKFVIILDDLWEKVSLERIGIPEASVGSKLVLTTRSSDVCRQVGCRVIKVKPLTEEEAWELFLEKVGRDILNTPGVERFARSIAKRCKGLPLGVITIASCMKGIGDICEWRNALNELSLRQKSVNGFEDEVFQQLQFSYDRLKDPKLQQCFLSCALYPEDDVIEEEDLIKLWIAEGLVEEMDSMQAEFDRGRAIMNRLISNCLLEVFSEDENVRFVKMHDLLRDMALHIAKSRFLVKAGMMLEKPPAVQEWSMELEKVSLMKNWRLRTLYPLEVLPPKCPRLTTLLLQKCAIAGIPEGFFDQMDALKVLDLSRNPIENLSMSLSKCSKLTALLLSGCRINSIPEDFFKHMDALKILVLSGNPIKSFSMSLSKCPRLTTLLLQECGIAGIPEGFFDHMDALKVLDLSRNPIKNLPNSLSNCSMLTELLLSSCRINSIPEDFFKHMDALKTLDLSWNRESFNVLIKVFQVDITVVVWL